MWRTLDIADRAQLGGHRILHLEDVVGPGQRTDIPGLAPANAVLLFSVRAEDCRRTGPCIDVAHWTASARQSGGLVVGVVLTDRDEGETVRARLATMKAPIPLAVDPHGVVRSLAKLTPPGTFVLIDSQGESRRWTPSAGRATVSDDVRAAIREAFEAAASPRGAKP
ncbi:MAG: hypothetical protein AAF449_10960 [Myxococcota bacterium]